MRASRATWADAVETAQSAADRTGVAHAVLTYPRAFFVTRADHIPPDGLEVQSAIYHPEVTDVPCVQCGRSDLPLHVNHKCPECYTPAEEGEHP